MLEGLNTLIMAFQKVILIFNLADHIAIQSSLITIILTGHEYNH